MVGTEEMGMEGIMEVAMGETEEAVKETQVGAATEKTGVVAAMEGTKVAMGANGRKKW